MVVAERGVEVKVVAVKEEAATEEAVKAVVARAQRQPQWHWLRCCCLWRRWCPGANSDAP